MSNKNLGFDVLIKFKESSPFGAVEETRYNVTEIHCFYKSVGGERDRIAFESDIHGTGGTLRMDYIEEYEAKLSTKINDHH